MYLTWDGSTTWEEVRNSPLAPWSILCFFSRTDVYAAQGRTLFRSQDSGCSWRLPQELPHRHSVNRLKVINGEIWIVGDNGLCANYAPASEDLEFLSVPLDPASIFLFLQPLTLGAGVIRQGLSQV